MSLEIKDLPLEETDLLYIKKIVAPGYAKEDISVIYNAEGILYVRIGGDFESMIFIPSSIDYTKITNKLKDGILYIEIPREEEINLDIN